MIIKEKPRTRKQGSPCQPQQEPGNSRPKPLSPADVVGRAGRGASAAGSVAALVFRSAHQAFCAFSIPAPSISLPFAPLDHWLVCASLSPAPCPPAPPPALSPAHCHIPAYCPLASSSSGYPFLSLPEGISALGFLLGTGLFQ